MHIEKLVNKNYSSDQLLGNVDIILGYSNDKSYMTFSAKFIPDMLSDRILHFLKRREVYIGEQFGTEGLEVTELLASNSDFSNTVFEMSGLAYQTLPSNFKKGLKKFNIVCFDYMEGGYFLQESNVKQVTGGLDGIPWFMAFSLTHSIDTKNIYSTFPNFADKKHAIVPIHKPRWNRLYLLNLLDKSELLEFSDWSLTINFDEDGEYNDFDKSPNVSISRWKDVHEHEFVVKYKDQLPKKLDDIEFFSQCIPLSKEYHGNYKWHFVCETYPDLYFATEKTWKSMIAGHIPVTIAKPGFNKLLQKYGFQVPGIYDKFEGSERIEMAVQMVEEDLMFPKDYEKIAEHNFNLITDLDFVAETLAVRIQAKMAPTRQ